MRLLVIGSANIDLTFYTPGTPKAGVTEICAKYLLGFGGKGANQAVQAARLNADVTFIGKVGNDLFGPAIVEQLRCEGINTTHVTASKDLPTGTAVILVDPTGQNSIITHAGPNIDLTASEIHAAASTLTSCDVLLATLEVPAAALFEAFSSARAHGIRTILNPAPAADFPADLLKLVDICVPNEAELLALVGECANVQKAAELLRERGPSAVIVTLGDKGYFFCDELGSEQVACNLVQVVDSSGAGDAFCAGLAVAIGEGVSLREAARWANAIAALSVTRRGTQAAFAKRAEIDRVSKNMSV